MRLIALNTNFFSTSYKNCGQPGPDPGTRELEWLDAELDLARRHGKRVWLLFHIPPGMNVYNTIEYGGACPDLTPQTFWKDDDTQKYLAITAAHQKTIAGSFAGHTHQDEFRLATGDFVHITPSVTPIFGNRRRYCPMTPIAFNHASASGAHAVAVEAMRRNPNACPPFAKMWASDGTPALRNAAA